MPVKDEKFEMLCPEEPFRSTAVSQNLLYFVNL